MTLKGFFFREVHFGREKSHTKYDRPASSDSFDITGIDHIIACTYSAAHKMFPTP